MQEIWVQSLGCEDPLEKKMATHSNYSWLGNPMDRETWQAIIHGVANSQTRLSTQACVHVTLPSPTNHPILTLWQHFERAALMLMLFTIQVSHLVM